MKIITKIDIENTFSAILANQGIQCPGNRVIDQGNIFPFAQWIAGGNSTGTDILPDGRKHHYRYQFDVERSVVSKRSTLEGPHGTEESGWDLR